ncbi:DEAD/DEAH box helicase [Photobacterium leiognathi]|uniref:DEAD/DEAH box helicase n=1 Tax=Photobacterium leiognathi TaxID=553611 RepID=UPI002739F0B9|nr:DEAD/DEAH box helicase [Photobacterium leiognathi]
MFDFSQKAYYYLNDSSIYLTKEQKDLFDLFSEKRRLVVSAPTSFGKSRVMREIIANNSYNQIIIIVPTNALLSETYFTFRMDERLSCYNLIFSTHIKPIDEKSIYIFTPEKFDAYTDEYDIAYDFFVFDEVYKIDSQDNRSSVFSNCLYKAYKKKCDYYLIGPYFNNFSSEYLKKTNGYFKKYDTDIVQKSISNYLYDCESNVSGMNFKKLKGKDPRLKTIIKNIEGQTIVYVGRKDSAESRARFISDILDCQIEKQRSI